MPEVRIDANDLAAYLVLGTGERLDGYEALIHVARAGVRHGLLHEALSAMGEREGPAEVLVARAVEPDPGADARIETPLGNGAFSYKPRYDRGGRAIFPELPLPGMARLGEIVAVKIPAVPPSAGRTVTGGPHGAPPKPVFDVALRAGLGTELALDGLRVVASCDGNPACTDGIVTVRPERKLSGALGPEDGDMRFGGNVFVAGDVRGAIELLAAGDVTVLGDIEGARVAAGGRVVVHGTIARQATVVAGTDVIARAVENAIVRCAGQLIVREDLVVATVEGATCVIVGAAVEGGSVSATEKVEAMTLGGASGVPTRLAVVAAGGPAGATPHIYVRDLLHPGFEVRIARATHTFNRPQPAAVLREAAGAVAIAPMERT